jgi:hypothetical protein
MTYIWYCGWYGGSKGEQYKISQRRNIVSPAGGLGTTAETNLKVLDFLDVTFDLENESFKPYCKPNNVPQ